MATLSPQVLPLAVALFGLGLGWNLLFVGGSALLSDRLAPAERGRVQGVGDVLIGLASALASLGSGAVLAFAGYEVLGLVGAVLALLPLGLSLWWLWARPAQERPKKRPERLAD
jgi:MFS family permease